MGEGKRCLNLKNLTGRKSEKEDGRETRWVCLSIRKTVRTWKTGERWRVVQGRESANYREEDET